jgi:hypothetical protein
MTPQKIKDKYNPGAADLRAYQAAKAEGRLAEYWAGQGERLKAITGDASPPVALAAPAAAAAGAS